jgi:hypothetical protein
MSVWTTVLKGVIGDGIGNSVIDYFKIRATQKSQERIRKMELEDALHARKIELISKGLHADMQWEQIFADGAASTWKDEYTLTVVYIPLVMCFIPSMNESVLRGFEVLDRTPDYFKLLVLCIFLATFGIRFWRRNQSDT